MSIRGAAGVVVALAMLTLTACASDGGPVPAECAAPPIRLHAESHGGVDAGGPEVEITDAFARRTNEPPGLTLYLADFEMSRDVARSADRSRVIDGTQGLLATVRLDVAPGAPAIATGDVLRPNVEPHPQEGSWVAGSMVSLNDGDPTVVFRDTSDGQVTIVHLDHDTLCADIDLTATLEGELAVAIRGTVRFDVVVQEDP